MEQRAACAVLLLLLLLLLLHCKTWGTHCSLSQRRPLSGRFTSSERPSNGNPEAPLKTSIQGGVPLPLQGSDCDLRIKKVTNPH
jgi:hypothetical protein